MRLVARAGQSFGLCVRTAAWRRPTARDDCACHLIGDDAADGGVGRCLAQSSLGQAKRNGHHMGIKVRARRGSHLDLVFLRRCGPDIGALERNSRGLARGDRVAGDFA